MSSQNEDREHGVTGSTAPAGTGKSNAALSSRFQQMFPVLSATEIDRIRRFGDVERSLTESSYSRQEKPSPGCT